MSVDAPSPWVQTAIDAFTPWHTDQTGEFSPDLIDYVATIAEMFEPILEYCEDQPDGTPGWGWMMDPDTAPVQALPWLAQWVGERLPAGLTEGQQRQWIKDAPNQIRGTKKGIAKAAQRKLTGSGTVMIHPRHKLDGTTHSDYVTVLTLDHETSDPAGTREDILSCLQADIVLNYAHPATAIWAEVETIGTWADVEALGTWADVTASTSLPGPEWLIYTFDSWAEDSGAFVPSEVWDGGYPGEAPEVTIDGGGP